MCRENFAKSRKWSIWVSLLCSARATLRVRYTRTLMKVDRTVAIAVRIARTTAGMSQIELARACGVTVRHIFAIEHGSDFSVGLLLRIARELPVLSMPGVAATLLSALGDSWPDDSEPRPKPHRVC